MEYTDHVPGQRTPAGPRTSSYHIYHDTRPFVEVYGREPHDDEHRTWVFQHGSESYFIDAPFAEALARSRAQWIEHFEQERDHELANWSHASAAYNVGYGISITTDDIEDAYNQGEGVFGDLMSLADAAEVLGVNQSTLRQQVHNGRLNAVKLGRNWVVTGPEVERYRRENLGNVGRPAAKG